MRTASRLFGIGLMMFASLSAAQVRTGPDPALADRFKEAVGILETPSGGHPADEGFRLLRMLDTPEAMSEIVRRFHGLDEKSRAEIDKALLQTRRLSVAVAEMQRRIGEPDFPVEEGFLDGS